MFRPRPLTALAGLLLAVSLGTAPAGAQRALDTIDILKDGPLSNVDIAIALAESTPFTDTSRVLIGRDDAFADSLASGVMQTDAPLLLVPSDGPVPTQVRATLAILDPDQVVLLGGEAAVDPSVAEALAADGYTVERRAGASRIETAVEIATREAPQATTAILARAFADTGADPTQAFADAMAAGGMSARNGWPVLLTDTATLSAPTRAYLEASGIEQVEIMGGTAAISQAVEQELRDMGMATERIAGGDRAGTAVAVAGKTDGPSAADADHVVLVDAQHADAWAGGFAAASHAAALDGPIVLAAGDVLPPATEQWLRGNRQRGTAPRVPTEDLDGPVLTCVTQADVCEQARIALGLPPAGIALVSAGPDGAPAGGEWPAVTADGTLTAYVSDGSVDGVVDDGVRHVWAVRDGEAELVDVGPDGTPAEGDIAFGEPVNVGDGVVAFTSPTAGLDPDAPEGGFLSWGYLRDLDAGTTTLVTLGPDGEVLPNVSDLDVSADGTVVSFRAQLAGGYGIVVRDLVTEEVLVVADESGEPFADNSGVGTPALSDDGSTLAFSTDLPLVAADTDEGTDVYVVDVATGALEVASVTEDGGEGTTEEFNDDGQLGVSADGSRVVFATDAPLVEADTNDTVDVYLRDRSAGTTELLSRDADGGVPGGGQHPAISADGRWVVFAGGPDPVPTGEGACGVRRFDTEVGDFTRVNNGALVAGNNCPARQVVTDGGVVVFDAISAFTPGDEELDSDVFRTVDA